VVTDHLPRLRKPQRGIHIAVGCPGRDIAVSTSLAMELARRVNGSSADDMTVTITSIRTVPFHTFRAAGVAAATRYKRFQDKLELKQVERCARRLSTTIFWYPTV
jgi:gamma-glutamyl:cysteine ligase YbdK (ATP-grasp superfamily)